MQTCYNCGTTVPDEALICPECGALVRRYSKPQPTQPSQELQPEPLIPPVELPQKLRFVGPARVLLILFLALSAYMAFSSLCTVLVCAYYDAFMEILSEPGFELYAQMLSEYEAILPQALPLFSALLVLFLGKVLCHAWLLGSCRRLPFYISIGVSVLGFLAVLFLGGTFFVLLYFLDPLFIWLSLRQVWERMPK